MRTIRRKKYRFRCPCGFPHDRRKEERRKVDLKEMATALQAKQEPLGAEFEQVLFEDLWDLYAR